MISAEKLLTCLLDALLEACTQAIQNREAIPEIARAFIKNLPEFGVQRFLSEEEKEVIQVKLMDILCYAEKGDFVSKKRLCS